MSGTPNDMQTADDMSTPAQSTADCSRFPTAAAAEASTAHAHAHSADSWTAASHTPTNDAHMDPSASVTSASSAPAEREGAMCRVLFRHRDAPFALCTLLPLESIAALHATCRAWRRWLDESTLQMDGHLHLSGYGRCPSLPVCAPWLARFVSKFTLAVYDSRSSPAADEVPPPLLSPPSPLPMGQLALRRLRELSVTCIGRHLPYEDEWLAALMRQLQLGACPLLQVLSIQVSLQYPQLVDFSALPMLPHLQRFELIDWSGWARQRDGSDLDPWRCTADQVACLAACRSLTWIDAGSWSLHPPPGQAWRGEEGAPPATPQQAELRLQAGLGTLVQSMLVRPPVQPLSDGAAMIGLTHLDLSHTKITPAVWAHLAQLRQLRRLEPLQWSSQLTAADWSRLADFPNLELIDIAGGLHLLPSRFLPAVMSCPLLTCLRIGSEHPDTSMLHLSASDMALIHTMPLQELHMQGVRFSTLASLSALPPSLQQLIISDCTVADYPAPADSRHPFQLMPHLPHLIALYVDYQGICGLQSGSSGSEVQQHGEPHLPTLLSRCPLLRHSAERPVSTRWCNDGQLIIAAN